LPEGGKSQLQRAQSLPARFPCLHLPALPSTLTQDYNRRENTGGSIMRKLTTGIAALALVAALSACGSPAPEPAAEDTTAATDTTTPPAATESAVATTAAAGAAPATFAQCRSCHAVEAGKNGVGPSLAGIVGRKAGTVAGYAYTDANKNSGLTWDEATLDEYLTAPAKKVPGTKMAFAGIADAAKRKEVIDYLKTLK